VLYVDLSTHMSQLAKFCAAIVSDVKTHTKRSQPIFIFNIIHVHFHATVLGKERTWKLHCDMDCCVYDKKVREKLLLLVISSGRRKKTYLDDSITHNSS